MGLSGREATMRLTPIANAAHASPAAHTNAAAGSGRLRRRIQARSIGGRFIARYPPPCLCPLLCSEGGAPPLVDVEYEGLPGGTVTPALADNPFMTGAAMSMPTSLP